VTESFEAPAVPDVAQRVFHVKRLPLAVRYAGWLADAGTVRGLIGPREVPRLWERHILNCAVFADALPADASVADIGSGAGLPGLVLAIARPDLHLTLIEPLLRRTTFLEEVVDDLGLDHVEVVRGRADALHGVRTFDAVTSRAVAALDTLVGWSMPLVAPTGALVAMKGSSIGDEIESARPVLDQLGCAEPDVAVYGEGLLEQPTTVVRVSWADPSRLSWRSPSPDVAGRRTNLHSKRRRGSR
jgi:16S rRNA (guanine527-N7)-methyltransferase